MKWWGHLRAIARAARSDLGTASRLHLVVFAVTVVLFAIDVPAHEAILGIIGGRVFAATANPLWVGTAVGATSLCIELAMATGVALNLRFFAGATAEWQARFFDAEVRAAVPSTESGTGRFADAVDSATLAVSLGSSAVVLKTHGHATAPSLSADLRTARRYALVLGVFNFCLGATVSGAAQLGRVLGWPVIADVLIRVATNPLTYVTLLVVRQVLKVRARRKLRQGEAASADITGSTPVPTPVGREPSARTL